MASIYDLSTTAASNTTIDGTDVSGSTGKVKDGDNAMRSLGAFDAQFVADLGAVNTVAGTADVITVALASAITAYATGQIFRFIAGAANTTNVTMNVNSIGAKAVRKISGGTDVALVAGDLASGETYTVIYRASANSAAGAWVLIGRTELSSYLTSATAASTYMPLAGGTFTGVPVANVGISLATGATTPAKGQIAFPATQNASSDANTLDDYEEGTFTPAFTSSGSTFAYTTQVGTYTKIGNVVNFELLIVLNTVGNTIAGNSLTVTGLPFATAASPTRRLFYVNWSATATSYVAVQAADGTGGSTSLSIGGITAAIATPTVTIASAYTNGTSATRCGINGTYLTA